MCLFPGYVCRGIFQGARSACWVACCAAFRFGRPLRGAFGSGCTGVRSHRQCWGEAFAPAVSATDTRAGGNAGSLTPSARPGISPASSWFLVGFVSAAPRRPDGNSWLVSLLLLLRCMSFLYVCFGEEPHGQGCPSPQCFCRAAVHSVAAAVQREPFMLH